MSTKNEYPTEVSAEVKSLLAQMDGGSVVNYSALLPFEGQNERVDETLKKMRDIMTPVLAEPESFQVITDYASAPMAKIDKAARDAVRASTGFAAEIRVFDTKMIDYQESMVKSGITDALAGLKTGAGALGKLGAKGAKGQAHGSSRLLKNLLVAPKKKKQKPWSLLRAFRMSCPRFMPKLKGTFRSLKAPRKGFFSSSRKSISLGRLVLRTSES